MLKTIIRANQERQAGDPPGPVAVHPLLWRLYRGRGVDHPADVERTLPTLVPPDRMRGLDRAVEVLARALEEGQRILVIGDFDADGATSCALALTALRSFGHTAVDFLVPNRFEFGYGLTPEIVEHAKRYRPDLIVTVDNGISSVAGVAAARALGWGVVVTDHHLAGSVLPEADAIVNPNLADNPFPSKALAGVGVIFYVLLGLRSHLRASGWFERRGLAEPNMAELLDLVALGTVADVVPLDRNNRVLVHHGLQRIRGAQCRPGIAALLRVAGRDPARAQANDLGFAAGPRLNAAGRMDDMALGIRCLLADDADEAWALASALDDLNRERRSVEQDMQHQAEAMLADWGPAEAHDLPWGLCLFHEDWHQGVIGILASRIKERHHRPVIAFAAVGDGTLKGSARSIPGLHIRDALDELAVRHPELLQRFGGHAMAAGMTIEADAFDAFAQAFDTVVRRHLTADDLHAVIHSDGALAPGDLNLDTARVVLQGGPWGQGFPEPTFDDRFEVVSSRIVGERHWKLVLRVPGNDQLLDAIAFNAVQQLPQMPGAIHAAYRLEENLWQGRSSLQLRIEYLEGPTMSEDDERQRPSKSARKRELLALQDLANEMVGLSNRELEQLGVDPQLRAALDLVRPMRPSGARNRQIKHCVKFMDDAELGEVRAYLADRHAGQVEANRALHRCERWRDRLINDGDTALEALFDEFPELERQPVRQLVREAIRQRDSGAAAGAARRLFRHLRDRLPAMEIEKIKYSGIGPTRRVA